LPQLLTYHMNITIRRALATDAVPLRQLACTTFSDTFSGTCTPADMEWFLAEVFNLPQLTDELSNSNDWYYVAEIDGSMVGYMRLMEDYSHFEEIKKWKALELKRIYVDRAYHGKGVGNMLLSYAEQLAIANSYQVLWLGVWEHNYKAKSFYAKMGFADSGFTHDFPIGQTPQTDNWLWKFFD
jgi:diamine N-acetyltransferase